MTIHLDHKVFNESFFPLLGDESRYLILKGGAGSGKSVFAAQKLIYRILAERGHRFLMVRKVGSTIKNSQYKLFQWLINEYGLQEYFEFRDSDISIRCPLTSGEIISVGMDDREKIKSITGITGIWFEEVTELDQKDFHQVNLRLRGDTEYYKQSIATFNPVSEYHWIRKTLFNPVIEQKLEEKGYARMKKVITIDGEKVPITYAFHHSTYNDNAFIDQEYKAELEDLKNKDLNFWRIYAKGEWGSLGNLVFENSWKILSRFPTEYDEVVYGIDFGFHHPSVLVKVGFRDDVAYVTELAYVKKMTNAQFIEYILDNHLIEDMDDTIYADSAEPDRINEFAEAGFNILPCYKSNNYLKDSIDYLKGLTIYTHKNNTNLNRELKSFKYAEDKDGNPIEGKVIPLNDDCIAATRYAIYSRHKVGTIHCAII